MPWMKVSSLPLWHRRILLDKLDCQGFSKLLESGFTLQETMNLLETAGNHEVLEAIRNDLSSGLSISSVFPRFCPKAYRSYITAFLRFLPFADALSLSLSIHENADKQRDLYLKKLLYPVLLLFSAVVGITFFNQVCFPSLLDLMSSFKVDTQGMNRIHQVITVIVFGIVIVSFSGGMILLWYTRKSHLMRGYSLLVRYFPDSVVTQYLSAEFIRYFVECTRRNIHTRQALLIIGSIPDKLLICHMAEQIAGQLSAGHEFVEAFEQKDIDRLLVKFIKIAVYSSNLTEMLEGYLKLTEERLDRQCKRLTNTVQLITYTLIGIVLIFVYQILMLPMSILTQL
ncbi:MAG: type II secretion system F family protein [Solobacterium sp.]|nr:type II secretion system F family protein [Solobacterium sp.]